MGRGRRYENEPKLNIKKVIATIITLIVIIMVIVSVVYLLKKEDVQETETVEYFTLYTNDKWGVINSKGEVVIEAKYDEMMIIPDNTKDIFIYTYDVDYENETYSTKVINSKEEELFTEYSNVEALDNYTNTSDVWYDTNALRYEKDGKYGLIDFEGNKLLDAEYDNIYTLKGLSRSIILEKDGKLGLYNDVSKDIILDTIYLEISALGSTYDEGYIVEDSEGKYGVIGPDKKVMLQISYDKVYDIYGDSTYLVKDGDDEKIVDGSGDEKLSVENSTEIVKINSDNYIIKKDDMYGIIDTNGETIIDAEYQYLGSSYVDYYIAKKDDMYGIIDIENNTVVDFNYTTITYRSDIAIFEAENEDYTTDIYNNECEYVLTGTISEVNTEKAYIRVRQDDEYKYYNLSFEEKSNIEVLTSNTLFLIKEDGKYGYVNRDGEKIVDCIYDDATEQNEYGFCAVKLDGKWGALKSDGTVVLEPSVDLDDSLYIDFIGKWHLDTNIELNTYTG